MVDLVINVGGPHIINSQAEMLNLTWMNGTCQCTVGVPQITIYTHLCVVVGHKKRWRSHYDSKEITYKLRINSPVSVDYRTQSNSRAPRSRSPLGGSCVMNGNGTSSPLVTVLIPIFISCDFDTHIIQEKNIQTQSWIVLHSNANRRLNQSQGNPPKN